jgi:hypothetical protein
MGQVAPSDKNVVIVDYGFKRSQQLATRFVEAGASVYLLSEDEAYEDSHWWQEWKHKSQPFHCLLALIHDTDRREWEEESANIHYDCLLYYSGGQSPFPEGYIQRSWTPVYGFPTEAEARELMDWISLDPSDRERSKPKLLTKFQPVDLLAAIYILCQTYLYTIRQDEQPPIAAPAPLPTDATDLTQAAWWAEALNLQYPEFDGLRQALQLEPLPKNLQKLLEIICEPAIETPSSPCRDPADVRVVTQFH